MKGLSIAAWLVWMFLLEGLLAFVWLGIDMNESCGDVGYDEGWTCNYQLQDAAVVGLVVVPVLAVVGAGAIYFARSRKQRG